MVIWVLAIIISSGRKRSPLSLQSTCCSAKWINESAIRRNCYSRLRETFPPLLDVILRHISSNDDFSLRFQFGLSQVSRHCLSDSHDQMWVSVSSISLGLISRCSHLTLNVVLPGLLLPDDRISNPSNNPPSPRNVLISRQFASSGVWVWSHGLRDMDQIQIQDPGRLLDSVKPTLTRAPLCRCRR